LLALGLLAACQPERPADSAPSLPSDALLAGIVRWDGVVAPFAEWDEMVWRGIQLHSFAGRSAPLTWHFISREGLERRLLGGRIVTALTCGEMYEAWGQALDFRPDTADWTEFFASTLEREWAGYACPMARIGLALSDTVPILPLAAADEGEARRILELVRPAFESLEADKLRGFQGDSAAANQAWTGHPLTVAERARAAIALAALERVDAPGVGVRLYRFKAIRRYQPLERDALSCPTLTSLEGFVLEGAGQFALVEPRLGIEGACLDAPGMQQPVVVPFGLLTLEERSFLLALEEGYEWSAPIIYEVTAAGLREVLRGWEW
jgi:hypothetical protein